MTELPDDEVEAANESLPQSPENETIRLDQFLKLSGIVETGGHAKILIQDGQVMVNGVVETRRRKQLQIGDVVVVDGEELVVEWEK